MVSPRGVKLFLASLSTAALVLVPAWAASRHESAPVSQAAGQEPRAEKTGAEVQARAAGAVPVFIVLKHQPQRGIIERTRAASAFRNQAAESTYRQRLEQGSESPAELQRAREGLDAIVLQMRQEAAREIDREIRPEQDALESRLRALGASRIGRYKGINMLTAEVAASALPLLDADPAVAKVMPVQKFTSQIVHSVPASGALTFWANYQIGSGQSVAVLDTGLNLNHPAILSVPVTSQIFLTYGSLDSCFGEGVNPSAMDMEGHGTHVSGIVASQGSSEGAADWTNYQGIAKGIDLYNVKIAYSLSSSCLPLGESYASSDSRDVTDALDWIVTSTPVSVLNFSYGGPTQSPDDSSAQIFDYYVDTYDLSIAIAAGNSGPVAYSVNSPGIGYNIVTAANWQTNGVTDHSVEMIEPSSSIGPTVDGRHKPDLAAPGTNIYSMAWNWDGNSGRNPAFIPMTGTSMSTPHLAGAMALIRNTLKGVSGHENLVAKALLINSADNQANPVWQPDRGWGYADLGKEWSQRSYYDFLSLGAAGTPAGYKFYKIAFPPALFKATAVWNRHLAGLGFDQQDDPVFSAINVNDVAMYLFNQATGAQLGGAPDSDTPDNVQQIAVDFTGQPATSGVLTLLRSYSATQNSSSEGVAVAFSTSFTPAVGPVLSPSCTIPPSIIEGAQFQVTCVLTNTGDLPAFAVQGQVVSSYFTSWQSTAMNFGDVPSGASSQPVTFNLTAPNAVGDYGVTIQASSSAYGALVSGSGSLTMHLTPIPNPIPAVVGVCPSSAPAGSAGLTVSLGGANFISGATVYWNSTALPTTYASATQLTASVPAALLTQATQASLTVLNPSGTASHGLSFTVLPQPPPGAGIITTVAGGGAGCETFTDGLGDGFPATSASLSNPNGLALDAAGNLYIAETGTQRVRMVTAAGIISTFAGHGSPFSSGGDSPLGDGGPATSASLSLPLGLAVDGGGNLYIADPKSSRVRKVTPGGIISTYAGNGTPGYAGDAGPATSAELNWPTAVAVDSAGNLYIADSQNQRVRMVAPSGTISTYAGNGTAGWMGDGGPAASAELNDPYGLALDGAGTLYIADSANHRIRKVTPDGNISAFAGNGSLGFAGDGGPAASAELAGPTGVAVDAAGNVYIGDSGNNRIRKVSKDGAISTYAGTGAAGFSGDGGPATSAALSFAVVGAVDTAGDLYTADGVGRVRKISGSGSGQPGPYAASLFPFAATAGGAAFVLTVNGGNFAADAAVSWDGTALNTAYTSPAQVSATVPAGLLATAGSHSVTVQNPTANAGQSSAIVFAVQPASNPAPWISASPNPIPVPAGQTGGQTTFNFSAPGHAWLEICTGSPIGPCSTLFIGQSKRTDSPVGDNTQVFLVDIKTQEPLAVVTIRLQTDNHKPGVPPRIVPPASAN